MLWKWEQEGSQVRDLICHRNDIVTSSLGFHFVLYIPHLKLKKVAIQKHQEGQEKQAEEKQLQQKAISSSPRTGNKAEISVLTTLIHYSVGSFAGAVKQE